MQIPILLSGVHTAGEKLADASILDIAPTVAALLGVEADTDWRGRSLL
jgi:arylsulfatase A-like enzyme